MHCISGFKQSLLLCSLGFSLCAFGASEQSSGMYVCVDAQGHRLTADRPIAECSDREQRILNPSGTVRQTVGPAMTAQERLQKEARAKQELEERNHLSEEKRRDKALLVRFPTPASHEAERADALEQISKLSQAAAERMQELVRQRKKLDDELEFYKKNPVKAPVYLQHQLEENTQNIAVQKRLMAEHEEEQQRINRRFDEELDHLRPLWAAAGVHVK